MNETILVPYGEHLAITIEMKKDIARLTAERDDWNQRYIELACAVWACPLDEFGAEDHKSTVREAESDAIKAVEWDEAIKARVGRQVR